MLTWSSNTATSRTISAIYNPIAVPSFNPSMSLLEFLEERDSFVEAPPDQEELIDALLKAHYKLYTLLDSDAKFSLSAFLQSLSPVIKYEHVPLLLQDSDIQSVSGQYRTKLPPHIFKIGSIVDRPFDPIVTWDDEFYIDGDYLYFLDDPRESFHGYYGGSGCYYYVLWLKDAVIINSFLLDKFFSYILGVDTSVISSYYDRVLFTKLIIEAIAKGLTNARLRGLAALYYGIPVSVVDKETIINITSVEGGVLVTTDKMEYFVKDEFDIAVAEEQTITQWTPLVSGFDVIDLHDGVVPSYVSSLPIYPNGLLTLVTAERTTENGSIRELENNLSRTAEKDSVFITGPSDVIYAVNSEVETTIVETERGNEISWPLEGDPDDVAKFWELVRERERTLDVMLYDLLSEYYEDLSTINPAEVMARFFYRSAVVIVLPPTIDISAGFIDIIEIAHDGAKPILQVNFAESSSS